MENPLLRLAYIGPKQRPGGKPLTSKAGSVLQVLSDTGGSTKAIAFDQIDKVGQLVCRFIP